MSYHAGRLISRVSLRLRHKGRIDHISNVYHFNGTDLVQYLYKTDEVHTSYFELRKDTKYLLLVGELWGVYGIS